MESRTTSKQIRTACHELVESLRAAGERVVLAESCTAGLIAASIAQIPGASDILCGSAVTYRNDTKARWLQVRNRDIEQYTAVSKQVAEQMLVGVLDATPEADLAAAITGHLGPNAPGEQDGEVFLATARRGEPTPQIEVVRVKLRSIARVARQREATMVAIQRLLERELRCDDAI